MKILVINLKTMLFTNFFNGFFWLFKGFSLVFESLHCIYRNTRNIIFYSSDLCAIYNLLFIEFLLVNSVI